MKQKSETGEQEKIYPLYQSAEERVKHFREFSTPHDIETVSREACRCMDCGIPFCHALGCPLGSMIPDINKYLRDRNYREAYNLLEEYALFPEITGRLCPGMCETACSLSVNDWPVSFRCMEYALAEEAFSRGWVQPRPPAYENRIKVSVVGSGPAGLACAEKLRQAGFSVTVYEKNEQPGGLLRYGIPSFKLGRDILDRRLSIMEEEGIVFRNDVAIGEDISPNYLMKTSDAVVLALGAWDPRKLTAIGTGFENVVYSLDYLSSSGGNALTAKNRRVLVIGGGETGADCVGTAIRQGAAEIMQFEIMDRPPVHEGPGNPGWPWYPKILRDSTSHREGGKREWNVEVYQFGGRDIYAEKAYCRKVEWYIETDTGKSRYRSVYGSEFTMDVDLVVVAAGFIHVEHSPLLSKLGITFDSRGNIKTDSSGSASGLSCPPGIYAAGDCRTGASLVAKAVGSGIKTAESVIERYTC